MADVNNQRGELSRRDVLRSVGAGAAIAVPGSAIDIDSIPFLNREVERGGFTITIVSSKPTLVSAGDARIRVTLPNGIDFDDVSLLVNGDDATATLEQKSDAHALEGVVNGLAEGSNTLELLNRRGTVAELDVVNHPKTGPMFAGPQQQPFGCALDTFDTLPDLDPADPDSMENCEAEERVDYLYKDSGGEFNLFDPSDGVPDDVAQTTTTAGKTVDYVVRIERGTINRFLYSIAMLAPAETSPDDPDYSAWNDKLIYKFEGGVAIGHQQGEPDEGDMLLDVGLSQGYAVVYSTGTATSTHYNLQVGGETALMVKEEFVERHGDPEYTVGLGSSGGAIQQYVYGQNHPELLDAGIPVQSYPDMVTQTIHTGDCELLEYYMDSLSGNPIWANWENRQWLEGLNAESDISNEWTGSDGTSECVHSWRGLTQLTLNPFFTDDKTGLQLTPELLQEVEWTHWADLKQIYGLDEFDFARRTWDNVGVQYGLQAFREGKISADEFLQLNATIGSWKETRNMVPPGLPFNPNADEVDPYDARNMNHGNPAPREEASLEAIEAAYEEGIVFHGEIDIPLIDVRPYLEEELDMHNSHQSFAARQRMIEWKGHADNQVIWFIEPPDSNVEFLVQRALETVDEWMANVHDDPSKPVGNLRPSRAVDACFDADENPIAQGDGVWDGILGDHECGTGDGGHPGTKLSDGTEESGCGECASKFKIYTQSRIVAGAPIGGDVFKCQRKSVEEALEDGTYGDWDPSDEQIQLLKEIFPDGVCDYSKPDAGLPEDLRRQMQGGESRGRGRGRGPPENAGGRSGGGRGPPGDRGPQS